MTTADLLAVLPAKNEDDRWELKSATYLQPDKKSDFKKELAKQVSAFANSGGGYLVFGISNDRQLEPCTDVVGRQSMGDFLSTMTEQSVEQPIRHFRTHSIPFSDDSSKHLYVIEVEDSPAAPHQAKEERQYYYRIDGHSKPAPHFHLELLRNRMTKVVLRVNDIGHFHLKPESGNGTQTLKFVLQIVVENQSSQSAAHWGLHLKCCQEDYRWSLLENGRPLTVGACVHPRQSVLLPSETITVDVPIKGFDRLSSLPLDMLRQFWITVTPTSHNHVGEPFEFCLTHNDVRNANWQIKELLGDPE